MKNFTGKLSLLVKRSGGIKKGGIKLPIAMLLFAALAIGGGLAYQAVALSGINLTAPTGGEYWSGTEEITWNADCGNEVGQVQSVQLYSINLIDNQSNFIGSASCTDYSYLWDTENLNGSYKIKAKASNDSDIYDVSGAFTLDNTDPTIQTTTLTVPNGGEFWAGGSSHDIAWTAGDITDANLETDPISLYYSTDGSTWTEITTGLTNTSPYSWTVPTIDSSTVKVKIVAMDLAGNTASDESDADFTIDSTNPVFTSVGVNDVDTFYKAGDTISFVVNLEEADLTVTANLTVLDTALSSVFPLVYVGNGTYTGTTGALSSGTMVEGVDIAVTITATDQAGNYTTNSSLQLTIDKTDPTVAITSTETGTATNADPIPVTITFNEEVVGFVEGDIDVTNGATSNFQVSTTIGVFTVDIIPIGDGTVTVDVATSVTTDIAGNGNTEAPQFSIIYDGTAPVFTSDSASTSWVSSDAITFTVAHGTSGSGADNMHNYVFVDNNICNNTVDFSSPAGTQYTPTTGATITVSDENKTGQYLCLVAMDLAGNFGYESVGPFKIDTVPASITIDDDASTTYVQSDDVKFTITYGASEVGDTEYVLTGGTCAVGDFSGGGTDYTSGDTLTFADEADEGKYVCLRARDGKGDEDPVEEYTYAVTGQLKIDNTNPVVTIDAVTTPTNINIQTITGGYAEDHINTIYVGTVKATLNTTDNTYSATVDLAEGDNPIIVIATDVAGNTGTNTNTVTINLDTIIPTIENLSPADGSITNNSTPEISATLSDNNSGIDASTIVIQVDSVTIDTTLYSYDPLTGVISYISTELSDDSHTVAINVKDDAGNSATTESSTFTVDTQAPTGTVTSRTLILSDSDLTQEVTVTYNEPMDSASTPTITFSTTAGIISSNSNGSWTGNTAWTESFNITDANEEITGVTVSSSGAKDIAGNTEGASTQVTFDIDTKNPTPTVARLLDTINKTNLIQTVTVTYDETMNTSIAPTIVLTGDWGSQITVGWTTTTKTDDTYTATFTHNSTAEEIFDAIASVSGAEDLVGNNGVGGTSATFVVDTIAPTVVITSTEVELTNANPIPMTATFSEPVSNFIESDVVVGNGTIVASSLVTTDNIIFDFQVTPIGSAITVDIAAGVVADSAGNGNTAATQFSITYDGTVPELVQVNPVLTPNNVSTPSYTFSSTEAGTITYENCKGNLTSAMAGDNTVTFDALSDGTYGNCKITVTDTANNSGSITVNTFVIDTQASTITDLNPVSGSYVATNTLTISATLTDDNSGIDANTIVVTIDTTTITGCLYNAGVISCSLTGVVDSPHIVTINVNDNSGNPAMQASTTFVVDTTNPEITIDPVTTPTNIATQTITGTYTETNMGTIFVNGVEATISGTNYTAINVPLAVEGNNTITAVITDLAGNTGTDTDNVVIVLDTQDPTVNAGTDKTANAEFTQDATVTENGSSGIASYLWTNESTDVGTITFGSANDEDTTISADTGTYTIRLTVVDNAGNSNSDTMELIWDSQAPVVKITSPLTGTKVNGDAVVAFTDDELTDPQCSVDNSTWTACTSETTILSDIAGFSAVNENASFTLYLKDTDTAGNTGTDSEEGIIKDTILPTITDITSDKANGSYTVGEDIDINITFSENIISDGDITVTLNTNGTCVIPQITTAVNMATCEYYTVAIGENTADLDATVLGLITDEAGNAMTDFTPDSNKTLMANKDIVIDTAAPTTTDDVPEGWQILDVTVTLTCDDSIGGNSGCSKVYYTTDNTDPTTSSNSVNADDDWQFTVLTDGEYMIKYMGEDVAGNLEDVKTAGNTLQLDKIAPSFINETPVDGEVTSDTTPLISIDFVENGSRIDIDSVKIVVNYADVTTFATITEDGVEYTPITQLYGINTVEVDVNDLAGNSAAQYSWQFGVDPTQTTILTTSDKYSAYADGVSEIKITAQILEEGNPVTNGDVNFTTIIGTLSTNTAPLDSNGNATAILTSTETGSTIVTASYDSPNGVITSQVYLNFSETPKTISVIASPASVPADGITQSTITATISDNDAPIVGGTVNFISSDMSVLSESSAVSNENGEATVTLTSTNVIWGAQVEASYTGSETINGYTYVEFTEYEKPDTIAPTAEQYPADNSTNVAITVNPYIDFSEAMDETTLVSGNVELRKYSDDSEVAATLDINGAGNRVTFIPDSDLGYDTQYYFYVDAGAKDLAGNSLSLTWTKSQQASHEFTTATNDSICHDNNDGTWTCDIPLNTGWNLISLPLIPNDSDIATVLAGISNNVEIVWSYENKVWTSYDPISGLGGLNEMEDGKGYWIYMKTANNVLTVNGTETAVGGGSPTNYKLVEDDWNLIGFKSTAEMKASDYIGDFTDKVLNGNSILWDYENGSYPVCPLHGYDNMKPGYGYWLLIK